MRNSFFNSSSWAINSAVQLLMIPLLVRHLGLDGYGIYILLVNIIGYSVLADLGLGQGVIKFVAELKARGDAQALNRSVSAALWVQMLLGGAGMALLVVFSRRLLLLLKVPPGALAAAQTSLWLCAVAFLFTMISGTFMSVLMGLQRYDLTSRTTIATNLAMNAGIVLVLLAGGGITSAVAVTAAFSIVNCLVFFVLMKKNLPALVLFTAFDPVHFRKLLGFSGYIFISRISTFFCNYVLVFIVSFFLGPAAVPLYAIPLRLTNGVTGLISTLTAVIFPYASEISIAAGREKINGVLVRGSRLAAAIAVPVNLAMAAFAMPILVAWMGRAFADRAAPVLSLLALVSLLGSLTMIPNLITMGLGFARVISFFSLSILFLFLLSVPLGLMLFGVYGAAWAVLFSIVPGVLLVVYEVKKIFAIPFWHYAGEALGFHLLPALLTLAYFILARGWLPGAGIGLLALPAAYLAFYFLALIVSRQLPLKKIAASLKTAR
ncbi:MAG: oligosaccharide flippase family protein [Acidobacteriota bacterium]|nr:oligosaccharide flippase family protein [Acidobacteriota bacterium]